MNQSGNDDSEHAPHGGRTEPGFFESADDSVVDFDNIKIPDEPPASEALGHIDAFPTPTPIEREYDYDRLLEERPLTPVDAGERHASLDVMRGLAVLGILLVNIGSFALVVEGRRQPNFAGGTDPLNFLMWQITYLLADTKFIMVFTMLFGAGIAVMRQRNAARGQWGILRYYRRMIALAIAGTLHGYLLWDGDILFLYAVYGLVLFPFSFLPAQVLFMMGALCIFFDSEVWGWAPAYYSQPSPYAQIEALRGGWLEQLAWRAKEFGFMQRYGPWTFALQGGGAMLLGMALLKNGFLAGKWPRWIYALLAVGGLVGGVLMIGLPTGFGPDYDEERERTFVYWGSLIVTFGWISFAVCLARYLPRFSLTEALAATGRMALTNYLMQTVICTTVFYGHGLGWFQRLDRVEMMLIVLAIWVVELTWSPIWLNTFRFGPFEWLWRTITYWQFQPMLRRPDPIPADAAIPEFAPEPQNGAVASEPVTGGAEEHGAADEEHRADDTPYENDQQNKD